MVYSNNPNDRNILPHPYESTNESNESSKNNYYYNDRTYCPYNNYINKESRNVNEPLLLTNHEMHFGQVPAHSYNYQPTITRRVNVSAPSLQLTRNADNMYSNPFQLN